MRRFPGPGFVFFLLLLSLPVQGQPQSPTRQAADRLMTTIGLEQRVDAIVQLYVNFLPTQTPEQQSKAATLRERAPMAGPRFRSATVNAAAASYTREEIEVLDAYFASGEGQRLLNTVLTRAVLGVSQKGGVKGGDILRPEDLPKDNPALQAAAAKYPKFEANARRELQREFAQEIALITGR